MGTDIPTLIAPLTAAFLPFVRILAFIHFSPVLDQRSISRRIKIGLALALTAVIAPLLPQVVVLTELLSMRSVVLIGEQIVWGFIFGALLQLVFVVLQTAGNILSMNMGLGMAVMNDPSSGNSTTVISQIIFVYSVLLFFIMDGHLLLVTILFKSFTYWPPGQAITALSLNTLVKSLGWLISSSILIALPASFVMLLVQGSFGLLNRISPTLNLFSLGFPISMLFGLLCLALMLSNLPHHYLDLTNYILAKLDTLRVY